MTSEVELEDMEKLMMGAHLDVDLEGWEATHVHTNGNHYQKLGVALHTETRELLVIYRNAADVVWARPIEMFEDGRFQLIGDSS